MLLRPFALPGRLPAGLLLVWSRCSCLGTRLPRCSRTGAADAGPGGDPGAAVHAPRAGPQRSWPMRSMAMRGRHKPFGRPRQSRTVSEASSAVDTSSALQCRPFVSRQVCLAEKDRNTGRRRSTTSPRAVVGRLRRVAPVHHLGLGGREHPQRRGPHWRRAPQLRQRPQGRLPRIRRGLEAAPEVLQQQRGYANTQITSHYACLCKKLIGVWHNQVKVPLSLEILCRSSRQQPLNEF